MIDIESQNIYQQVLNGGLFSTQQEEPYFSHSGCNICNNGWGDNVFDVKGFISLYDARHSKGDGDSYEFQACGECISKA